MSEKNKDNGFIPPPNTVERPRRELTAEMIERIMEKVQDIDQTGLAYSMVYSDYEGKFKPEKIASFLPDLLKDGLLGIHQPLTVEEKSLEGRARKERWATNVRRRKEARVYFNIIGRDLSDITYKSKQKPPGLTIANSQFINAEKISMTVIFDKKRFTEKRMPDDLKQVFGDAREGEIHLNEFRHDDPYIRANDEGVPMPSTEFGFVLNGRVRPSEFKGIVLGIKRKFEPRDEIAANQKIAQVRDPVEIWRMEDELRTRRIRGWVEEDNPEVVEGRAKEVANIMLQAHDARAELLLPIYDTRGNLLWPKRMGYVEVKKFVAEREASKKESEP